ncbi:hypothetical protein [Geotalea sp. SG265]|uniref:hypothetical protein n=1 Tax=Geotalea sp. SG265 TaxID=2922867 RepID=UPI001FB00307|nr:hypothetical protein [Geotalea sp. SG265]
MTGSMRRLWVMMVTVCLVVAAVPLCAAGATTCYFKGECGPGNYCSKPVGICGGQGTCAAMPQMCITLWNPVCGCDNRTYGNSCEASRAGVAVAGENECSMYELYANAPEGGTVYMRNVDYGETFTADLPKSVTLVGGFDTGSQTVTGASTFYAMVVSDGTLDVRNITLQ